MLEPRQIRVKDFGTKMRGYDPKEVSAFLNTVADAMEELLAENNRIKSENVMLTSETDRLKARIAELESDKQNLLGQIDKLADRVASLEAEEGLVKEALISARQKGEEIIGQARQEAERITAESEQALAQTRQQIEIMMDEAQKDRERIKNESDLLMQSANEQAENLIRQGRLQKELLIHEGEAAVAARLHQFEEELREDIRRWQAADSSLRQFKAGVAALLARIPDGIEAAVPISARELWDSIKAGIEVAEEKIEPSDESAVNEDIDK